MTRFAFLGAVCGIAVFVFDFLSTTTILLKTLGDLLCEHKRIHFGPVLLPHSLRSRTGMVRRVVALEQILVRK